ncbi:hypothetical protein PV327_010185 [Microctonus hyperodae]|uniref:Uncharacterized protein n=1 Tax=Microctonus hyperodae TaxID=165561 RepID=A0AA39KUT0_MICHY|nr:hypothetical protein PV327_010185 [Microctonus hyperodae]
MLSYLCKLRTSGSLNKLDQKTKPHQYPESYHSIPPHSEQPIPQSVTGASTLFISTTLNIPETQVVQTTSKLKFFKTPNHRPISHRAVKMREKEIRFGGSIKVNDAEYSRYLYEAIQHYGLTEEETIQIIPFMLESTALGWFRAEIRGSISYEEFLEQFKTKTKR